MAKLMHYFDFQLSATQIKHILSDPHENGSRWGIASPHDNTVNTIFLSYCCVNPVICLNQLLYQFAFYKQLWEFFFNDNLCSLVSLCAIL